VSCALRMLLFVLVVFSCWQNEARLFEKTKTLDEHWVGAISIGGETQTLKTLQAAYFKSQSIPMNLPGKWMTGIVKEMQKSQRSFANVDAWILALKEETATKYALSTDEVTAITSYTDKGSAQINPALRAGDVPNSLKKPINDLWSGMVKLPPYGEITKCLRVLSFTNAEDYNNYISLFQSGTYTAIQFESATIKGGTGIDLPNNGVYQVTLRILGAGKRGYYISSIATASKNEAEVLFLPGTTFSFDPTIDLCPKALPQSTTKKGETAFICLRESGFDTVIEQRVRNLAA